MSKHKTENINVVDKNQIHNEINVEKLNVVDKDGNIKMALFGSGNFPPPILDGKDIFPGFRDGDPSSGMIFYNGEGDECGGLIFDSGKNENGELYSGLSLTFDQYKQDQVVQIIVNENNDYQVYGINIFDRLKEPLTEYIKRFLAIEQLEDGPEKEAALKNVRNGCLRMFMGKEWNGDVGVRLNDSDGRSRIRIYIDKNDDPHIDFYDTEGNVVYSLPPKGD